MKKYTLNNDGDAGRIDVKVRRIRVYPIQTEMVPRRRVGFPPNLSKMGPIAKNDTNSAVFPQADMTPISGFVIPRDVSRDENIENIARVPPLAITRQDAKMERYLAYILK